MCEQRKEGACEGPDERVDGDGAVRVESVAVDQIAQTLPEGDHATETDERNGENLRYPCDVWITRPRKPEWC